MQLEKLPSRNWKKDQMQDWLIKHNVKIEGKITKNYLWSLIQPFRKDNNKRYVTDEFLKENGYEVLRLPPYHCEYNPIEMAWGFCKNYYNKRINSQLSSNDKVKNLWLEALSNCTSDMWQNFCKHCEKLISEDWVKYMGNISFENIPPFIISLEESESESGIENDSDTSNETMAVE